MCGITGIFNFDTKNKINEVVLRNMTNIISHRGPDDEGLFISKNKNVGLGHRRLSIIDLKSGHQPMCDTTRKVWIVFNGEIYNFPDIKNELIKKGYIFKTASDTEVIINFYLEYGEDYFYKLNGIFAFAIYDERKNKLVLARDHFGVKPLYYYYDNQRIIFGSEIKSILVSENYSKEIDYSSIDSLLTYRYNPSPDTILKGIKKLNPGHYLSIEPGKKLLLKNYWDYYPETNISIKEKDAIYEYQRLLENSVKRQLISDVPVGLLLSGGIDSAVIGKLMQNYSKEKIKTFSIGFDGRGDYNELSDANISANFIGSEHYSLKISKKEYMDFFLDSFYFTEEPIAAPTIPALYFVSKLASKYVKVVLAGQGADEPLAGYKRYFGEKLLSNYSSFFSFLSKTKIEKFINRNERLKRTLYAAQFSVLQERFLAIYSIFNESLKQKILKDEYKEIIKNNNIKYIQNILSSTNNLEGSLNKLLFIDTRMSLSDDLLLFGDKMSMANSLEMRVPFLDVELVKFLESLPEDFKLKGFTHKYIHKKALKKWLPNNIIKRKKRGFTTPLDDWLQSDFADEVYDIFNSSESFIKEIFNLNEINNMIQNHKKRKENFTRQIFILLSLELWYQKFFKRDWRN